MNVALLDNGRKRKEKNILVEVYRHGLVWSIANKYSEEVSALDAYCAFTIDSGSGYDFDESKIKKLRNLIHLLVNNIEIFDPSSEVKYYEVAFAMGVVDGISLYDDIDKIQAPRVDELGELLEWEEQEGDPVSEPSDLCRSGTSGASVFEPAPQGSLQ